MNSPNNPKTKKTLELLQKLGLDPTEIRRESSPELLIPKMAILGFLETVRGFCENAKASIAASLTGLNSTQLRLLFSAMRASVEMMEKTLETYENLQQQARARSMVDAIIPIVRGKKPTENDDAKPLSKAEIEARIRKIVSEVAQRADDLEEGDEDCGIFSDEDQCEDAGPETDQASEEDLDAFRSKGPKKPIIH